MSTVGTLTVRVAADINALTRGLSKAERDVQRAARTLESAGRRMTLGVTLPIVALAGVTAKMAADEERSMRKLARSFGQATTDMEKFIQSVAQNFPAADDEIRGLAVSTNTLLRSMGTGASQANELTKSVTKLAADLAAFGDTDIASAQQALEGALMGQTRGLKAFGVAIDAADVQRKAYQMGIGSLKGELSDAARVQATWALVLERTAAQQGEAARTAGDASNAHKFFKQAMEELGETIGGAFLPMLTPAIKGVTGLARSMAEMGPAGMAATGVIAGIAAVIGPTIHLLGSLTLAVQGLMRAFGTASAFVVAGGALTVGLGIIGYELAKAAQDARAFELGLAGASKEMLGMIRLQTELDIQRLRTGSFLKDLHTPQQRAAKIATLQGRTSRINALMAQPETAVGGSPVAGVGAGGGIPDLSRIQSQMEFAGRQIAAAFERGLEPLEPYFEHLKGVLGGLMALPDPLALAPITYSAKTGFSDVAASTKLANDLIGKNMAGYMGAPLTNLDAVPSKLDKLRNDAVGALRENADKIAGTMAQVGTQLLAGLAVARGGKGSQIGGAILGAAGMAAGTAIGQAVGIGGGKIGSMVGGAVGGPIGGIIGTIAGSFIGGLFAKKKKRKEDRVSDGLDRMAESLRRVNAELNVPSGYKVGASRYDATNYVGASRGGGVVVTGPITIIAPNPDEFARELQRKVNRGGYNAFALAVA